MSIIIGKALRKITGIPQQSLIKDLGLTTSDFQKTDEFILGKLIKAEQLTIPTTDNDLRRSRLRNGLIEEYRQEILQSLAPKDSKRLAPAAEAHIEQVKRSQSFSLLSLPSQISTFDKNTNHELSVEIQPHLKTLEDIYHIHIQELQSKGVPQELDILQNIIHALKNQDLTKAITLLLYIAETSLLYRFDMETEKMIFSATKGLLEIYHPQPDEYQRATQIGLDLLEEIASSYQDSARRWQEQFAGIAQGPIKFKQSLLLYVPTQDERLRRYSKKALQMKRLLENVGRTKDRVVPLDKINRILDFNDLLASYFKKIFELRFQMQSQDLFSEDQSPLDQDFSQRLDAIKEKIITLVNKRFHNSKLKQLDNIQDYFTNRNFTEVARSLGSLKRFCEKQEVYTICDEIDNLLDFVIKVK